MNIHNFDSGPGVEDIVRDEIRALCPTRYNVTSGVISDSKGYTAGDFDVIIFNDFWFTPIKAGATPDSRRVHYPVEGIYAVCEVKQSLSVRSLDDAMKKLVTCHRLHRPHTSPMRYSENRDGDESTAGLTNPLYSAIIAVDLEKGADLEELLSRFVRINQQLKRLEVVRALCIMGHGTFTWAFEDGELYRPALFMNEDLALPLVPAFHPLDLGTSALYPFMMDLHLHLFHSVLAPEDVSASYGARKDTTKLGWNPDQWLQPERHWIDRLSQR